MQIETIPIDELVEDEHNARTHPERNLDAIKASLATFDQCEPLVVRADSNVVIGGNGRLRAMRELGWTEAEIVRVDVTDEQVRALSVALNRSGDLAEWNYEQLAELVRDLPIELQNATGFADYEIEPLLAADWSPPEPEPGGLDRAEDEAKEGEPIRLTVEQRTAFDQAAGRVREEKGDLRDGEIVRLMAEAICE